MMKEGSFEVFDSNGAWSALFGKPLLGKFRAVHDYDTDTVKIPNQDGWTELQNCYQCQNSSPSPQPMEHNIEPEQVLKIEQEQNEGQMAETPQIQNTTSADPKTSEQLETQ
jgi:hypothetical protein